MPEFLVGCAHSWGTDWRAADDGRHARRIVAGFRRHGVPIVVYRIADAVDVSEEFINPKGGA